MLEARLEHASVLKRLLEAIKELVNDANFECNDEGIALQAMDNSHVALVTVMLRREGFQSYRCDRSMPLGINLASLTKIIKCAKDDDVVTIKAADDADSLGLVFEGSKSDRVGEYEMRLMDIDQEHLGIPDTSYDAIVTMSSVEFQKICRDLTSLGESVKIEVTKEGIRFSADGEIGSASVMLKAGSVNHGVTNNERSTSSQKKSKQAAKVKKEKTSDDEGEEDEKPDVDDEDDEDDVQMVEDEGEEEADEEENENRKPKRKANGEASGSKAKKAKKVEKDEDEGVSIVLQQSVTSTFSLKYLLNFTKSAPLSSRVSLQLSDEIPMLVGFEFDVGFINYYLAPKIGDE